MKLIQVIRPLFFVAVGLHVLVLFVPVGASDDPDVIEDVELSEVSEEKPALPPTGQLPVPDPNVAAAPATATAAKPAAAARRPAARAAATSSTAAARSTAAPNVAVADASATPRPGSATPSPNPSSNRPERQPVTSSTDNSSDDDQGGGSFLSTFIENEAGDESADSSNGGADDNNQTSVLTALLGKVTQDLSAPFREFSRQLGTSLAYDQSNTGDTSADERFSQWKESLQREANVGTVEQLEPSELSGLATVAYPIESSVQTVSIVQTDDQTIRLRGRNISICLPEDPHDAEVGVLLDAQGDVVDEPVIIRSTGYEALNNEIKAKVIAFEDFPRDGEASPTENRTPKAYRFEVEIDYDAESCVSLADLKE